jgi:hypothetical protein
MVRFSRDLYSYVDYANKVTLTILDECELADRLIDEFYIRSPNRVSDHILKRLNYKKQDLIHQMPTKYIHDLDYTHFLFKLDVITRLSLFFSQFNEYCWVTKEQFPKKPLSTFEDFCEFVLESYPENLDNRIMPYWCLPGDFVDIAEPSYLFEKLTPFIIQKEISGELLGRLNEYYNPLHS